jgi:osmotically-inducible protein OsmY
MFKNNFRIILSAVSISVFCFGCAGTTETNSAKNNNADQSVVISNNNVSLPATPAAAVNNNFPAASNNQTANMNKGSKPAAAVNQPTPKIGRGGDDMSLFTQVRSAFAADQELFNGVIVEIKEGNATLSGKVSSEEKKKKAEQLAQSIAGIRSVKNNVRVAP